MKILSYAWYIYDSRLQQYINNCTGGGLVVRDLCEFLGQKEKSYLFIGQYVFPEMKLGNINLVKTDYQADMKKSAGKDETYIAYMTKVFERTIEEVRPDIIHFHDCGDLAYSIIKNVCIPHKLKYVITCHLYIGKNPEFAGYERSLAVEERMLELSNLNLITVSSGMKKKILRDYPKYDEKNITPILNGTSFKAAYMKSDYRDYLEVGDRKVLLCAGSICYRKNQLQILRIFEQYSQLKEQIYVIFCGNMTKTMTENFEEEIEKRKLSQCMHYIGALSSEEMKKMYSISEGLIMPSYAEGLSISALEAIAYGVPVIMYDDSECALDLDDENVVSFAKSHTDESMVNAIIHWYNKVWDRDYIIKYAEYFKMERMADDYIRYYKNYDLK
ncbi:glycosyltransferase family 4 protein [Acetatifactor muris]|uniref:D-inositol-3-phosphate glycosyltransferase n=1 Tax=Acetatifactor muris TaxID=879566 RepID=A0A2K4ZAP4_9FIRM|nr:glycosyltransferase family 4 protein [Acetatifactor muris]MCR2048727.1 glycosyltransferase family 4 protein [Acetatifactor muris]SOY27520.1 D-inositol-3-phosphate glycosyltransferase [Acetatifactor muris]